MIMRFKMTVIHKENFLFACLSSRIKTAQKVVQTNIILTIINTIFTYHYLPLNQNAAYRTD